MPYKLRTFGCVECGQLVERNRPAGAQVRCINCAIARSVEVMRQMKAKSGPFYERWAKALGVAAAREQQYAAIGAQVDALDWPDIG